ncbi:hypothetical protein GCM10011380_34100 [Sphingomonas metalli]|uniref:DUF2721 domain-containing protein n=1 Tax=Sphingomonas metalli TaxID=1779358 RepID=A0A916TEE1_9SPHN|nr:DUF2721 domain-containing protein [Sphingomonas metalli]GGB41835.1 hypothetical protein GCM10011380_34100 [Sphingomonas metalli]
MAQLGDVLKAIGPNASIVFAAWIFMGFLQQRYDNAIDRYRAAVGDFRSHDHEGGRAGNLEDQILTYQHRCRLMGTATLLGLVAAILLIAALICGAADVLMPHQPLITAAGIAASVIGCALVIAAAGFVIAEGRIVRRQLDDELRDLPALAGHARHRVEGAGRDTPG